jgi:hypothetical protein
MASDVPEYMSTREAEHYSGLRGLAKRRVLGTSPPYIKTSDTRGGKVIYAKAAIDAWLAARTRKHTSEHSASVAMTAMPPQIP